jgi:DNA-directed RNA polymerase subunit RPC12/RpoP
MYLQMKLRHYDCVDCGTPCKSTSPNAVRCPKCAKAWEKERNRQNQRRRYQRLMVARRAG